MEGRMVSGGYLFLETSQDRAAVESFDPRQPYSFLSDTFGLTTPRLIIFAEEASTKRHGQEK